MEGVGLYKWADGNEYYGEYQNNIKQGNGKFKWTNGKIYEGPFVNGKPHGFGTLTNNKSKFKVQFIEGKLISNKNSRGKGSTSKFSKVSKLSTTFDNHQYKYAVSNTSNKKSTNNLYIANNTNEDFNENENNKDNDKYKKKRRKHNE